MSSMGDSIFPGSGTHYLQVPQACLVTCRRMVCAARELESEYSRHGRCCGGYSRRCMERQRRKRSSSQDAGTGEVLSQPIVSHLNL